MKILWVAAAVGLLGGSAVAGPTGPALMSDSHMDRIVAAGHAHYILTPGHDNLDLGSGQTSISDPNHGGYHRIHENVHLGVPAQSATANPSNPVEIGKTSDLP